jgi:hypothetical protein
LKFQNGQRKTQLELKTQGITKNHRLQKIPINKPAVERNSLNSGKKLVVIRILPADNLKIRQ